MSRNNNQTVTLQDQSNNNNIATVNNANETENVAGVVEMTENATSTVTLAGAAFLNTNPSISSSSAPNSRRGSRSNHLTAAGFSQMLVTTTTTTSSRVNAPAAHHHPYHPRHRSSGRQGRMFRLRTANQERNFAAAVCEAVVIATLCTAMAETRWFTVHGGGCNQSVLGVDQFFYVGRFLRTVHHHKDLLKPDADSHVHKSKYLYQYSANYQDLLIDCVDPKTVQILRSIIILCFLGILCSGFAFFLDLLGPKSSVLRFMRRNGIWNIASVVICVTINGFCFWVTQHVFEVQTNTKVHTGSKVLVHFDVGFYLIAAAGAVAVLASGCNCLRRYPTYDREHQTNLLDDYDGLDTQTNAFFPPMTNVLAPPPAYTP